VILEDTFRQLLATFFEKFHLFADEFQLLYRRRTLSCCCILYVRYGRLLLKEIKDVDLSNCCYAA